MTASTIKKYRTFTYNEHGKPIAVSLDLKNRMMKKFFETMMEDLQDTLDVIEALKEDDGTRYFLDPKTGEFELVVNSNA
jgi:hypothetical protein